MSWNHRIIFHDTDDEPSLEIHEVYYNDDNTIRAYTKDPKSPHIDVHDGDGVAELKELCQWIVNACDKPILRMSELDAEFDRKKTERAAPTADSAEEAASDPDL